ncbi:guanylate cyclase [Fragilaria crotonensis]|nr:guanylate cyclase [Fragilaria crotonensis]
MYERWADVADWVLLAFAPIYDVEHAVDVRLDSMSDHNHTSVDLQGEWGKSLFGEAVMENFGALDVEVAVKSIPSGFQLASDFENEILLSGSSLPIQFNVDTSQLAYGVSSFLVTFTITDDDYPDCFYNRDISLAVSVTVHPKDCAQLTGDPMRIADANGVCICMQSSVEIGGSCARYSVLLPSILVPLLLLGLLGIYLYVDRKRKQADSIWRIKPSDLQYDEIPEILGRGTFGLVVRAEYRGTQVAVKRVIPPLQTKDGSAEHENRLGSMLSFPSGKTSGKSSNSYFDFSRSNGNDRASTTPPGVPNGKRVNGTHEISSMESLNDTAIRVTRVTTKQYAKLKSDFIQEMRLLSKLRHPCITTVMGAVLSSGNEPLLVMELMDHGSLFDLLHNDSMVVEGDIVLQILRDVAQGLRFCTLPLPSCAWRSQSPKHFGR